MKKLPNTGFTLVELLVVVSIIAILTVIGIAVYTNTQKSARDARRTSDVDAIASALETNYKSDTGTYSSLTAAAFSGGTIPADPLSSTSETTYFYSAYSSINSDGTGGAIGANAITVQTDAKSYWVCAKLEDSGKGNYTTTGQSTMTPGAGFYCRKNQQ